MGLTPGDLAALGNPLAGQVYAPQPGLLLGLTITAVETAVLIATGPDPGVWRPPGWSTGTQVYSLTVPDYQQTVTSNTDVPITAEANTPTTYFFDAVLRVEHDRELVVTEHPVQTGAVLADHAYLRPSRITLEIGMSDAMSSYTPGQWTDFPGGKSVSAFQQLQKLQQARVPMMLSTRLRQYLNVLIVSIRASETEDTRRSLRATVTFQEVFFATSTSTVSGLSVTPESSIDPHTTNVNALGTMQTFPPPPSLEDLGFKVPQDTLLTGPTFEGIPGYGSWSSLPIPNSASQFE